MQDQAFFMPDSSILYFLRQLRDLYLSTIISQNMNKARHHNYTISLEWTGNLGSGTSDYRAYTRDHSVQISGKPEVVMSSDPSFRGDKSRYNPEELLVASLSSCHMLWYLHLCSEAGVIVTDYTDQAKGIMEETTDGGGYFKEVVLNPIVTVAEPGMLETANALHQKAHELCFIANSVNFRVAHQPQSRCKAETLDESVNKI